MRNEEAARRALERFEGAATFREGRAVNRDAEEKMRLIRMLASNYSAELDEDTATLWLVLMSAYSVEDCRSAVLSVVRGCGFESVRFGSLPPFALIQRELDARTGTVRGERNLALQL